MRFVLTFLLTSLLLSNAAFAQSTIAEPDPAIISEVEINYIDLQNVSEDNIRAHMQLREGMEYSQNLADRSVRSLYDTRLFDFIEVTTEDLPANKVKVIVSVQSKYRMQDVQFIGNHKLSSNKFRKEISSVGGQALDERLIRQDRDKILELYQKKGYTDATVDYVIDRNSKTGLGVVTFKIDEGSKLHISDIEFEGNTAIEDSDLRDEMQTKRYSRWSSWLMGTGRFDEGIFQEDLDLLRAFYKNQGYLDVSISESDVIIERPDDDEILIRIKVDEGRLYKVGDIKIEGNEIIPSPMLYSSLRLIPGDVFSPEKLDEDVTRLSDIYGSRGYLDCYVNAERVPNVDTGRMDIHYTITEGDKFYVEAINIEGNTKTKSKVILRELALQPGKIFNSVWMKTSENRLKNTRYFEEVVVTDQETNVPGRRDMKVAVKEAHTGEFQFGAGFSSLEKATIFFELSQSNFDLFNYRSFFQGAGQKFRLYVSIGSYSNNISLSIDEPYFLDQQFSVGGSIYRTESDYYDYYDELRAGFTIYARKHLFELVVGRLSYTLQNVDLDMNSSGYSSEITMWSTSYMESQLSLDLTRDTRNNDLFTTSGSRYQFTTTWDGLGGDIEYLRFESRNAMYIPTFETADQSIALLWRVGSFWRYAYDEATGDGSVPINSRFFLGGPKTLRGFEYREVGPRDRETGDMIGGHSFAFGSVEYTFGISEQMRFAIFYDWGFVNSGEFDWNPSSYNDNWGIGIRLMVMGNPLSLDFGIPITSDNYEYMNSDGYMETKSNDTGSQFNFSFGTRF
ncbi:MAG: outer membrane protein assembly factor BamA [Opitutales bacterium]|nr:outer membrane protein assembly factor BamA [Opitutales bacterium]